MNRVISKRLVGAERRCFWRQKNLQLRLDGPPQGVSWAAALVGVSLEGDVSLWSSGWGDSTGRQLLLNPWSRPNGGGIARAELSKRSRKGLRQGQ
jgi:hypothetical protein